jgi:hypothetical protein
MGFRYILKRRKRMENKLEMTGALNEENEKSEANSNALK